jgi:hypothetical protein
MADTRAPRYEGPMVKPIETRTFPGGVVRYAREGG